MCGIAGWVSFDRDLREPGHRAVLADMTAAMALRGPDAEGMWVDRHVGFGHRRLSVIDLEGGRQPMLAECDGRVVAALTYSGEVYNFQELRSELMAKGHTFRTRSDTEVVLAAYLEWGEDLAEHLNGMFAFAIWDVRHEVLLLVRDRLGVKPLCYMCTSDGVLFGSEAKAIFAHPETERRIDRDGLRGLMLAVRLPEQGIFAGVNEVRPGQTVRLDRAGLTKRTYWKLQARPHTDDQATTVAKVRELLLDIVARQTVADVPLCSLLSGGLDSSIVTALADRHIRAQGGKGIRSFSVDFVGSDTLPFEQDAIGRQAADTPFVRDFVRHVGNRHEEVVIDNERLLEKALVTAVNRARDYPQAGTIDLFPSLWLLFEAVRRSSTVALSGEAADEVFGGYAWMFNQNAIKAETFPWLAGGARAMMDCTRMLHPDLQDKLDMPTFEADAYQAALAEAPRLEGEGEVEARMREMSYLNLTRFLPYLLDRKDRMSMAHGLEVRVPFCDHHLVEYAFNIPWVMKTFDGHEKSVLRAAFADVLPDSIVERRKSPYPATTDSSYESVLRDRVSRIAEDETDPAQELLDANALLGLLARPLGNTSSAIERAGLEAANGLSCWLHDTPVSFAS